MDAVRLLPRMGRGVVRGLAISTPLSTLSRRLVARFSTLVGTRPNGTRLCFRIVSRSKRVCIGLVSHAVGVSIRGRVVACLGDRPRLSCGVG